MAESPLGGNPQSKWDFAREKDREIEEIKKRLEGQVIIRPETLKKKRESAKEDKKLSEMVSLMRSCLQPKEKPKALKVLSLMDFEMESSLFMAREQKDKIKSLIQAL